MRFVKRAQEAQNQGRQVKIATRKQKYMGRTVRTIACKYLIRKPCGSVEVDGYAVDAGQIPRLSAHMDHQNGLWSLDDWDTGKSIAYGITIDGAIFAGLNKLATMGESAYRRAVAGCKWPDQTKDPA